MASLATKQSLVLDFSEQLFSYSIIGFCVALTFLKTSRISEYLSLIKEILAFLSLTLSENVITTDHRFNSPLQMRNTRLKGSCTANNRATLDSVLDSLVMLGTPENRYTIAQTLNHSFLTNQPKTG